MKTEMVSVTGSYWDTLRRSKEKQVNKDREATQRNLVAPLGGIQGTLIHFPAQYMSYTVFPPQIDVHVMFHLYFWDI